MATLIFSAVSPAPSASFESVDFLDLAFDFDFGSVDGGVGCATDIEASWGSCGAIEGRDDRKV